MADDAEWDSGLLAQETRAPAPGHHPTDQSTAQKQAPSGEACRRGKRIAHRGSDGRLPRRHRGAGGAHGARGLSGHAAEHEQPTRPAALGLVRRPQRIGRRRAPPPPSPHELVEAARRRLRKATKAERQCDDAAQKLVQTPSLAKDQGLVAKAERREGAAAAAAAARADLALAQAAVDADNAVKGARRAAAVARHHAEASQMLSVKFDDKYACAVCTEVLEAAVTTGVCEHIFCRGCLEDHCAQASKPSECVCPLCRKPLVNDESGRVEASAAALVRANMKKLRGECHCGARMPLSRLRDHLRACGPNAHLYPPRRKFGHEFRQPSFVGGQPAPSIDLAAEEEAALPFRRLSWPRSGHDTKDVRCARHLQKRVVLLGDIGMGAQSRFFDFLPFFSGCDTTLLGGARDFSNAL